MVFECSLMICGMRYSRDMNMNMKMRMSWVYREQKDGYLTYPPPFSPPTSVSTSTFHKDSSSPSSSSSGGTKISPAVMFIIVILAVLFFISGLLHLLVRFLIKHPSSSSASNQSNGRYPEMSTTDALQRQLQQLFHLHDSGLDQAFIDALPVFQYKEIVGLKEPFDCAVCLCEFTDKDKLRLLPMCSHAFHINCIDTWLLSNSTCPLCRGTLFTPGFSIENPMFDFDDFREEDGSGMGCGDNNGLPPAQKSVEIEEIVVDKGILPVRLGKFRRLDDGAGGDAAGGETSSSNLDARRCYSMGSYQYVLHNSDLRVPLCNDRRGHCSNLGTVSENNQNPEDVEGKKINSVRKGESFSVSKIWLWPKKGKFSSSDDHLPDSLKTDLPWMKNTKEQH